MAKRTAASRRIRAYAAAAAFSPLLFAGQAFGQHYDAFKQYSIKANPSGPWSYLSLGQLLTTNVKACNGIKKDLCWTNGAVNFPNVAAAEANKTNGPVQYLDVTLPAKYLDFDPEGVANVAFQWTSPAAAKVRIVGNFLGVAHDEGSHEVAVLHNGTALGTFTISQYQQLEPFKYTVTVGAGDTVTFISYTGNGGGSLSTGLQATIITK